MAYEDWQGTSSNNPDKARMNIDAKDNKLTVKLLIGSSVAESFGLVAGDLTRIFWGTGEDVGNAKLIKVGEGVKGIALKANNGALVYFSSKVRPNVPPFKMTEVEFEAAEDGGLIIMMPTKESDGTIEAS